jgi:hypothetical protein
MIASEADGPSQIPNGSETVESRQPIRKIWLPGFIVEHEIGLGDVIKRATTAFGIKPCGECEQRASLLNKWMVFGPGKKK